MEKELFSSPRWNQDPGAVVIKENDEQELSEETKEWLKEEDKKWEETLKKLKAKSNEK